MYNVLSFNEEQDVTELIRVDFKSKKIKSRVQLPGKEEVFDPKKDEFTRAFVEVVESISSQANEAGVDHTKMILILHDKEVDNFWILFENSVMSSEDVQESLAACIEHLKHVGDVGEE